MVSSRYEALLDSRFCATADIYTYITIDAEDQTSKTKELLHLKNLPCYAYRSVNSLGSRTSSRIAAQKDKLYKVNYLIKVLFKKGTFIPSGSRMVISQNGMTFNLKNSSCSYFYPTHTEVTAEVDEYV